MRLPRHRRGHEEHRRGGGACGHGSHRDGGRGRRALWRARPQARRPLRAHARLLHGARAQVPAPWRPATTRQRTGWAAPSTSSPSSTATSRASTPRSRRHAVGRRRSPPSCRSSRSRPSATRRSSAPCAAPRPRTAWASSPPASARRSPTSWTWWRAASRQTSSSTRREPRGHGRAAHLALGQSVTTLHVNSSQQARMRPAVCA